MKTLSEIVAKKRAVFAFGRMNPPTAGHEKLIVAVMSLAQKMNATPFIFLSHTQDAKKNPLSSTQKLRYIQLGVPNAAKHVLAKPSVKTPFDAVAHIIELGYTDIVMVAGADRVDEFKKTIGRYINHPDPEKSLNLSSFNVVSAGERDPDAEGTTGISGTKMRDFVAKNDFDSFLRGVPSKLSRRFAKDMFDDLRKSMHLSEMTRRVSHSLNIPRRDMPQIRRPFIPEFLKMLKERGVNVTTREISVHTLKPTQNEINMARVQEKFHNLSNGKEPRPFIVSYDNHILDGHHQLFALLALNPDQKISCHVIGLHMKDLIQVARDFPKTTYKELDE